ncbi:hypothetical protein D3C80_1541150 [compost metagenome]
MGAVDLELIVQVWPGRQASSADVADDLALLDVAAGADAFGEALHVGIEGAVAGAVLDDDGVAVAPFAPGKGNLAIASGFDRGAAGCGVVDALVRADFVQDRVAAAVGEA